ncbi:Hpt domain-containing protein [Spongiibacter sp. KMU-158]|uniref:Chemotaxis protein CheA n=1 Tax=Spongiibacter pelagi TaxID=2760804 RepID=A0A927C0M0_9GAMM|nr:Hpt domain-containing protein [Spongiibacter pelagi]MBD2857380.1 Hpt domain-containing protein [Spongiibacter pelagi]
MLAHRNVVALEWLAAEVRESLQRSAQTLATFCDHAADSERIQKLARQLHLIQGSLRLAEFSGPAQLLEEMEAVLSDLAALPDTDSTQHAAELRVLENLCRLLPDYLQEVRQHQSLQPFRLIPLFDHLRAAVDKPLLSAPPLFSVSLDVAPPSSQALALEADKLAEMAAKLDKMGELALTAFRQGSQRAQSCDYLFKVFARAAKLSAASPWENFWLLAQGLIVLCAKDQIAKGIAEQLLQALHQQLAQLASELTEHGLAAFEQAPPAALQRRILFHIACSESDDQTLQSLRERYFTSVESDVVALEEQARVDLARMLNEQAQLGRAGAELDGEACLSLATGLAVLGESRAFFALRGELEDLAIRLDQDNQLGLLTLLEEGANALQQYAHGQNRGQLAELEPTPRKLLAERSAQLIEEAQDAVMSYVDSGWLVAELEPVSGWLWELSSSLREAQLLLPAALLDSCALYIDEQLIAVNRQPEWAELDALADAMSSVDYYLARSVHGNSEDDQSLLALAERCVTGLGYPPRVTEAVPETVQELIEPVVESGLDPEILEVFLEEAAEVLDGLLEQLPKWERQPESTELLAEVRRAFHTLKGSGRMAGAMQFGELAWLVEDMLNRVVDGQFRADAARFDLLKQVVALLPEMLAQLKQGRELPHSRIELLEQQASALARSQSSGAALNASPSAAHEPEVIRVFVVEAGQHLQTIENYLDSIVNYPVRLSDELQRSLHTLKGSSKMAEVWPLANIISPLEELVKELRAMRVTADKSLVELIATVAESARNMLRTLRSEPVSALQDASELIARIEQVSAQQLSRAHSGVDDVTLGQQELLDFLLHYGDHLQKLMDLIDQGGDGISAALFRNYAGVMGQFANRSEEIGSQATAEMAQALQVMFSRTRDPLPAAYPELVRRALEQLMVDLNQLASQQSVDGDNELLDSLRDYEEVSEDQTFEPVVSETGVEIGNETSDEIAGELVVDGLAVDESGDDTDAAPIDSVPADEQVVELSTPDATHLESETSQIEPEANELAKSGLIDADADPEILEIFLEEGRDLIDSLDESIHLWSEDIANTSPLDGVLRSLHTLKGGARLSGLSQLGDLSHQFEGVINAELARTNPDLTSLLHEIQRQQDVLVAHFNTVEAQVHGVAVPVELDPPAEAALPSVTEPGAGELVATAAPSAELMDGENPALNMMARGPQEMIKVPAELLEQLINLSGETSIARGRVEEQVSDINFSLDEMEMTVARLQDQVRVLDRETEAQILFRREQMASEGAEGFDPLEFDRYSHLQELSRALMESASDLIDLRSTVVNKKRDVETLLTQQARVNSELQEGLMRSQMVHFSRMVPRLRRGVRQVAGELGKQVEFRVFNADGEMDRRVLERIIPVLEHLLRNSIDHGIEVASRRQLEGKPPVGYIDMHFERQGGDVVIRIADDGAGINLQNVRRKAESLGLMDAQAELTDAQLLEYIFHAGFSTAENVTQISGRGVGMDVVRSELKQLGGGISVSSESGKGTEFTIRLPFTISVNRALLVSAGGEIYAVPLNSIEGIVRISPYELEVYYEPGGPDYNYAGQSYKVHYLGQLLGSGKPVLQSEFEPRPVLLIRNADPASAVQVDSILGAREVVVKTLGPQFAAVPGLSGATILGDGGVVIILDILASIRANEARLLLHDGRQGVLAEPSRLRRKVMVVDDSVTVRKVTSRLLERQSMDVVLARDGLEAMQLLQSMDRLPDVMLLDIEMPRMDGFEVASQVKGNPHLAAMPIIVISSRTGDKHRQRARTLGVSRFLGKPYQEIQLLKTIDEVLASEEVA